jgi:hypothetical protein
VRPISGLWRISDGKGESELFSCSELRGGSSRPCWLRNDRLGPMSKFNYVIVHADILRSILEGFRIKISPQV